MTMTPIRRHVVPSYAVLRTLVGDEVTVVASVLDGHGVVPLTLECLSSPVCWAGSVTFSVRLDRAGRRAPGARQLRGAPRGPSLRAVAERGRPRAEVRPLRGVPVRTPLRYPPCREAGEASPHLAGSRHLRHHGPVDRQMAAQVADRFDLGPDARPEVEAARGEQGQVRRVVTARGTFAVKESFDAVDAVEAQRSAEFQAACHDAGVPCPRPLPDVTGPLPRRDRRHPDPGADLGRRRRCRPAARPGSRRARPGAAARGAPPRHRPAALVGHRPGRAEGVARAGQGGQGRGGAVRGPARGAGPGPARDGGPADADGRRPVVPPRPVGRQRARHARRRGVRLRLRQRRAR